MRKVTFGGANSLDNYLARPDHAVDWLLWGDEVAAVTADFWKTTDTILMGRKTYEVAVRGGQGGYPGVTTYVFSRPLRDEPGAGVTLVREDAAEFVRETDTTQVTRSVSEGTASDHRSRFGLYRSDPIRCSPPRRVLRAVGRRGTLWR